MPRESVASGPPQKNAPENPKKKPFVVPIESRNDATRPFLARPNAREAQTRAPPRVASGRFTARHRPSSHDAVPGALPTSSCLPHPPPRRALRPRPGRRRFSRRSTSEASRCASRIPGPPRCGSWPRWTRLPAYAPCSACTRPCAPGRRTDTPGSRVNQRARYVRRDPRTPRRRRNERNEKELTCVK